MDDIYDVIVIGAGLAGLAAARLTQRAGARTLVLEAHDPGGRARSDSTNGFVFNRGPHALYLGGPAERVLADLGVPLTGGRPGAAYALRGDRIAPLPAGARALLTSTLLGIRGKAAVARLLGRIDKLDARRWAGVTVSAWLADLDLPADADQLVRLLVRIATYAEAPDVLSAEVAISQIQAALRHGVRYLDGGWQSLVDGLAVGLDIAPAEVVRVAGDASTVVVASTDATRRLARNVIVAAGSPVVAARLLARAPFAIGPPVEAACLDLGVHHPSSPPALFGLDEPLYLSTHCPPARLAPAGMAAVAVARYVRAGDDAPPDRQRAELEAHARRAGIDTAAVVTARYLHRMTVISAIATAEGGGLAGRPTANDAGVDGVLLAGDWVGPTGHLADASLASAAEAARLACARVLA